MTIPFGGLGFLQNPVPGGADGLLDDAHDTAHALIFHAHFVEDEEEGVLCWQSDQRSSDGRSWADIIYYLLNNERKVWKDSQIWEFVRTFAAKL